MNYKDKIIGLSLLMGMMAFPGKVLASPHFTLNPASGTQTIGQNFAVALGVDSDTEKVVGIDIKATYDTSKLDIVSIEKANVPADGYQFSYVSGQTIVHSDTGMFEVTLSPINQSVLTGPVAKHDLLLITFRPKVAGVATVNFTCLPSSVVETNIISPSGTDVVDCNANQSGSYTIVAGSSGTTATPTPTTSSSGTTVATATPVSSNTSLPQTAGFNSLWLVFAGALSVGAAFYMKLV